VIDSYTEDTYFHRAINLVLRQQRYDLISLIQYILNDLIESLRQSSLSAIDSGSRIPYRGQQMTIFEIDKLKNNVGECVVVSSFLSTTQNRQLAEIFAGDGATNEFCFVSVIFKIDLHTSQPMRPYTLISNSAEEEVLLYHRARNLYS
jgi:hypothetical protein